MKKYITLLALLMLSTASAAESINVASAESKISIDPKTINECNLTSVESYTRHLIFKYDYKKPSYYLITQKFEVGTGCFEGNNPEKIVVTAKNLDPKTGKVEEPTSWHFETDGVTGVEFNLNYDQLYKVDIPGCCSSEATYKYYSLNTGKLVSSSTVDLRAIANIKSNTQIVIGAESNIASSPLKKNNSIASLFLGDRNGIFQEISIISKKYSEEDWYIESMNFVFDKEAKQFYKNSPIYSVSGAEGYKGITFNLVLNCRCEHNPLIATFKMGVSAVDIPSSFTNESKDIELK